MQGTAVHVQEKLGVSCVMQCDQEQTTRSLHAARRDSAARLLCLLAACCVSGRLLRGS
jgi:hypothetical protein